MRRAAAFLVALLPVAPVAVLAGACDAGEVTAATNPDAAGDARRDRQTPTAQEETDDGPACARGDRTSADVPIAYRDLESPLVIDDDVIAAGGVRFADRCALCHGDEGRGDGREGPFDPMPADFTKRRRSDAYLFWRISEGGGFAPFCSAMPAFRDLYTESQRWAIVAFIQAKLAPATDAGSDAADAD